MVVREVATGKEQHVKLPNLGVTGPPQWSGTLDKFVAVTQVDGSDRRAIYLFDLLTVQRTLLVDQARAALSPVSLRPSAASQKERGAFAFLPTVAAKTAPIGWW